jgi:hypothetical protein
MKLPFWTIAFFALLLAQPVFAQKEKNKNKDVEIIDFGDDSKVKNKQDDFHGIIIKTSPTTFIAGRQSIEIEKQVKDFLSLQIGVGVTFKSLLDFSTLQEELYPDANTFCESTLWGNYDVCDYYLDRTIRKNRVGPLVSFSPRLFFESDGFEGFYVAPVLRWSANRYQVQKVAEGETFLTRVADVQDEYERNLDLVVHYGGQSLYPQLTYEWFVGAGVRLTNALRQDVGIDGNGGHQNADRRFKESKFRMELGIRVGIQR